MPWASQPPWVAYVSNLAVSKAWRGRKLGSLLVASCEQVALRWGFDEIYLHAATQQEQLLRMYDKLNYDALPSFDQPAWVLMVAGREPTRYHRKVLRASVSGPAPIVEA
jgi:GNAT superfamily N-acetyltransferase